MYPSSYGPSRTTMVLKVAPRQEPKDGSYKKGAKKRYASKNICQGSHTLRSTEPSTAADDPSVGGFQD